MAAVAFISVDHNGHAHLHTSDPMIWENENVKRLVNLCAGGAKNETNH